MKRLALLLALGLAPLAACSERAQEKTGDAADAIAADMNATAREAVDDVNRAGDKLLGQGDNAVEDAGDRIEDAARSAGNEAKEGARDARREAGEGLRDAGDEVER